MYIYIYILVYIKEKEDVGEESAQTAVSQQIYKFTRSEEQLSCLKREWEEIF